MNHALLVLLLCKLYLMLCCTCTCFPPAVLHAFLLSIAVYVGLTVPVKYVREPLSNNPIDVTSVQLKVMVRQDTQVNTTICYTTVNGTAKSGINYQHTQGKLLISADVKFVEFTVNIFTEQHSSLDKWFIVSLHSCNHDDNVILLPYNSTRIAIMNLYVGEPFFPTLPIVRTISADAIMNTEGQLVTSYTEPLMCVTVSIYGIWYLYWRQGAFRP